MAHVIKYMPSPAKTHVSVTSRYAGSKVIQYTEDRYVTFETYKRKRSTPAPGDQWMEITKQIEYRPDLVSVEIYGAPDFWWRLLEYNGMKDIMEFKAGKNIRVPGDVLW